jgi:hypothetical protein
MLKVAGFAKLRFNSDQRPDHRENEIGIPVLQTGVWREITAEFNPAGGVARIECDGKVETLEIAPNDALPAGPRDIVFGSKLNQYFQGCIDDVVIEEME